MGHERECEAGMNIIATIFDNRYGNTFDVSQVIGDLTITTYLEDNPGKAEFTVLKTGSLAFWEGATVSFIIDGVKIFRGYVFSKSRTKDVDLIKVTAYDQLRYMKNKDSRTFEGKTSDQIFSMLCNDFVLKHRVVDKSSHVCAPRNEDATSLYDMVKHAMDDTLANSRKWFFIRDNFGTLEHLNVMSCNSGIVLGDASGVVDFDYETSIDSDVYNQIKLYRDNTKTGKREVFIVNDTINGGDTLKRWGILQLYQKIDEKYNIAQIEQRATSMLRYYNSVRRKLTLECLGVPSLFAGCIFKCAIADLGDISMNSYLLVTQCVHTFKNNEHMMKLTTEVVRNE